MYEEHDKDGNVIGWRITRRVKNENGKFDCIIARSKISEEDCHKQLEKKYKKYMKEGDKRKKECITSTVTFSEFADQWYELNIEHADCTQKNKDKYKGIIFKKIIPYLGDMLVCKITEDDCQRMLNQLEGLSKHYVSSVRMTLNRIMKKAVRQKLIPYNPAEYLKLPNCYHNQRRPLTDKERELLYLVADYHEAGPMFVTMLHTGLRPIEIRNLKWEDIDFENNVLRVTQSKTQAGVGRLLPIDGYLREKLEYQKNRKFNKTYVFCKPSIHRKPLDDNAFRGLWKSFRKEMDKLNGAKFYRNKLVESTLADDLTPYMLRHTFCTDCQTAGVPINVAKELMGHSDISVTSKIYTHMVDEVFEMNAQRLEEYHDIKVKTA